LQNSIFGIKIYFATLNKLQKIWFYLFFTSKTTLFFNKSSKEKSLFGNMDYSFEPCAMFINKVVAKVKTPPVGKGINHSIPYPVLKPYIFSFFSQLATVHHCKGLHSTGWYSFSDLTQTLSDLTGRLCKLTVSLSDLTERFS